MAASAALFTWQLSNSGLANAYYSAAVQAGAQSWKAMFFGSLDASNALTVDKPPLSLWPMILMTKLFGLSPWSVLLPQALEGVMAVALLYGCVHRTTRRAWPAVLAGVLFALTPVTVLMFRYNNPDALLTTLLLFSAYSTLRACESRRPTAWLVLAGSMIGLGFLTKMLAALLVLPALALSYLIFAQAPLMKRFAQVLAGALATLFAGGWWVAVVELWPASSRPWIGGSPVNSVLQLALGYNGVARITGSNQSNPENSGLRATNIARIGRTNLLTEVTWFVPAALILAGLAWYLSQYHPARRNIRAALLLWFIWIGVTATTFAAMAGIFHSYYTVVLAPAFAALVGIGAWLVAEYQWLKAVRYTGGLALALTSALAVSILLLTGRHDWAVAALVCTLGIVALVILHLGQRNPVAAYAAIAAVLVAPALSCLATISAPHTGANPMAGAGRGARTSQIEVWTNGFLQGETGGYRPVSSTVLERLRVADQHYRWSAGALGARSASAYQLSLGRPVLAIGGYKGDDPVPTLDEFIQLTESHQLHWFIPGGTLGASGRQIQDWVISNFTPIAVDGVRLYEVG
ncbi:ArnT family glycosyltransferase [Kineosporia mesophila]|uniref:ArnT family glycosyltransferase n=1 Tax=Kineosporia mesophila TaxID=566012 RepID=UPI001E464163|nr:glycosyltransferase family 39 protein [Kineosporia mesophila]MCD5353665.1 glycosyltransferase family 39 protein [Kineosporia mesophila]